MALPAGEKEAGGASREKAHLGLRRRGQLRFEAGVGQGTERSGAQVRGQGSRRAGRLGLQLAAPGAAGGERARVCARAAGGGGRRRRRAARPSAAPRRAPRLGELMAAPRCGRPAERRAQPPAAAQGASRMWGDRGGRSSARDGGAQQPPLARLC